MSEIEIIKRKHEFLGPMMNAKMRRLWVACEARPIGPNGENTVAIATGISKNDIHRGLKELEHSKEYPPLFNPKQRSQQNRIRRPGGGRKLVETKDPSIFNTIEHIVENEIAGDPMSEKKWVRISTKKISKRLRELGYHASAPTVSRLLKDMGFSMRANKKRQIRDNNPARDQQFKYIARQRKAFSDADLPIISVDAKKKELVGNFSNKGKTWCKEDEEVNQNDYPSEALCRAVPYGIYDVIKNAGYVFVGTSNNTPEFAVDAISSWWEIEGSVEYQNKNQICILADGGGSNGWRSRAWKKNLQNKISDKQGLILTVCHYPTGCAKWNPIDHRLFS